MRHSVAARFRVYPLPDERRYVWVIVFHDEPTMFAFWGRQNAQMQQRRARKDFLAMSTVWLDKGRRNIGQVLLRRGATDVSIVTHEFAHMALFYVRDLLKQRVDRGTADEAIADAVGHMTAQFYRRWWRAAKQETCSIR